ncbi:MAG: hypothetical protein HY791_39035 [Deltaproteobacteria bacterium]|nr:hypothetical protein [Deltaproteobacteria bacterium]
MTSPLGQRPKLERLPLPHGEPVQLPPLERLEFPPDESDLLYYDPEFDVPTSSTHRLAADDLKDMIQPVADQLGLRLKSDEAIWYIDPQTAKQKVFYGDLVLCKKALRTTAHDLHLVIEVVSTNDSRRELKDTIRQRIVNEANRVPEFGLIFPDLGDNRSFQLFRYDPAASAYVPVIPTHGSFQLESVPDLEIRVLPRAQWTDGRKIDVYFKGQRQLRPDEKMVELQRLRVGVEDEKKRAEDEKKRAEDEKKRAEDEKKRAERFAAKLRALGVDPDE